MKYIPEIILISSLSIILTIAIAYGASLSTSTIDNAGRREYTYCPISDTLSKSLNAEINGCPLVRIYVNNWNSLTPLEQSTIDSQLRVIGFVDSGEHILK